MATAATAAPGATEETDDNVCAICYVVLREGPAYAPRRRARDDDGDDHDDGGDYDDHSRSTPRLPTTDVVPNECRLPCGHAFHASCFANTVMTTHTTTCVVCNRPHNRGRAYEPVPRTRPFQQLLLLLALGIIAFIGGSSWTQRACAPPHVAGAGFGASGGAGFGAVRHLLTDGGPSTWTVQGDNASLWFRVPCFLPPPPPPRADEPQDQQHGDQPGDQPGEASSGCTLPLPRHAGWLHVEATPITLSPPHNQEQCTVYLQVRRTLQR